MAWALSAAGPARAKEAEPRPLEQVFGEGNFAFGPSLGFYRASGLAVWLGVPQVAANISAGYMPLLITHEPDVNGSTNYDFFHSAQVDVDLSVHLLTAGSTPLGLRPGYRYNTALGHGFAVGGYAFRRMWRKVGLDVTYGLVFYPEGAARIRARSEVADDAAFFLWGPVVQGGLSGALLFFP